MCGTCGCGKNGVHEHQHDGEMTDHHHHAHTPNSRLLELEAHILAHNNEHAASNQRYLDSRNVRAFNLMSSPGSGKTALLEKTLGELLPEIGASVIVGDQRTDLDAERLRRFGGAVCQIETGEMCHLDAARVGAYLPKVIDVATRVLFIENVGNLICPAAFNLGEHLKVALLSVTEGEDKPLKYPAMFSLVDLVIITKIDLLPHLEFDLGKCRKHLIQLAPRAQIIALSSKSGEGFDSWLGFVRKQLL